MSEDYARAKTTLLHAFESTQGSLGKRVLNPKRKPGQRAAHLAAQLQRAWSHWIEGLTHQEICARAVMVQLELMLPPPCRNYIQTRNPMTVQEMVADIERFFAERGSSWDDPRWGQPKPIGSYWRGGTKGRSDSSQQFQQRSDKEISAQTDPKPSGTTEERSSNSQWRGRKLTCYACNAEGHIACNCPEKGSRVNRVKHGKDNFVIDAQINGISAAALVDSGADVTVVPAKLVAPSAYTGQCQWTGGLNGPLSTARVKLTVCGKDTEMTVVTKEGLPEILLGLDYPGVYDLLIKSASAAKAKIAVRQPLPQLQLQPKPQTPMETAMRLKEEDLGCLAAEAEDLMMDSAVEMSVREEEVEPTEIDYSVEVKAVQTRAQKRQEQQQQQADDEASAHSEANPVPLSHLDDSLFGESKSRQQLPRSQRGDILWCVQCSKKI